MANIKPFYGIRYNEKNISAFICPPYDIISEAEKSHLKKLSPHNIVSIELPDSSGTKNKYSQAGVLFKQWQKIGVLSAEEKPSFYLYEQNFTDHGRKNVRMGFFAALKLEDPRKGDIKPHEKTLAKPKQDRLSLLRSVRANVSPIFGLFSDKGGKISRICKAVSKTTPLSVARDNDNVSHKIWKIDDAKSMEAVKSALVTQKIFIADGHHRYETAWNFSQEMKKKDKLYSAQSEYNYVLTFLCPMEDPGLSIWPTHRVLEAPENLEDNIEKYFNILPASKFKSLSASSPQPLLVYTGGKLRTLVIKNKAALKEAMPDKCQAYRELGVSILHSLLLSDVPADKITYVKDEKDARALADKRKCIAVMAPSTPIEAVKEIALAGQTMPQKSTYFYPKVATGIVMHSVKPRFCNRIREPRRKSARFFRTKKVRAYP